MRLANDEKIRSLFLQFWASLTFIVPITQSGIRDERPEI